MNLPADFDLSQISPQAIHSAGAPWANLEEGLKPLAQRWLDEQPDGTLPFPPNPRHDDKDFSAEAEAVAASYEFRCHTAVSVLEEVIPAATDPAFQEWINVLGLARVTEEDINAAPDSVRDDLREAGSWRVFVGDSGYARSYLKVSDPESNPLEALRAIAVLRYKGPLAGAIQRVIDRRSLQLEATVAGLERENALDATAAWDAIDPVERVQPVLQGEGEEDIRGPDEPFGSFDEPFYSRYGAAVNESFDPDYRPWGGD